MDEKNPNADEKIPEAQEFRERIVREDDLLDSRTTLFLVTNGLLLTAIGLSKDNPIQILISVLGCIVTSGWILTSFQTWRVIRNLTRDYLKQYKRKYIEKIVRESMFKPGWRRPSNIIAIIIPIVFLITWICILLVYILRSVSAVS